MTHESTLSRRVFLKLGAAAGGGLLIGASLPEWGGAGGVLSAAGTFEPNIWLRVGADDTVLVRLTQLEMGQGVMTALPMLVAEELDVDFKAVRTEWVGADRRYGNPGMGGQQITAGSDSVRGYWKPLREAGAAARAMLVTVAAKGWGVAEGECTTANGEVIHKAGNRRVKYGALVDQAAALPVPQTVALKSVSSFGLVGRQSPPRFDIPEKVDGRAQFGLDVARPNMLVARVVRCPVFGGKVKSLNADKAKAVPGVRAVVQVSAGVAVAADDYFSASKGAQALEIVWAEGPLATLTSAGIRQQMVSLAAKPGNVARNQGDVARALGSPTAIERVFEVPFLAHACMEPMNCTAEVTATGCDVWAPTQSQTSAHEAAIAASGLPKENVRIHTTYLGGGFGRRGEADYVTDAVETSKAVGRPVKVVWTREDDIQHDFYRPVTYIRMWGSVEGGKIVAWQQRIVQQSLMKKLGGLGKDGVDRISVDGAATLPYDIPNLRVEYTEYDPGVPYGFWRSVGNSVNGYVTEAFFDELAAAAGQDPFELRRSLLGKAPRHKLVLEKVAAMAGWGTPTAPGRFRGISVHEAFGSIVGTVTEVSVAANGTVRVHKIDCAVDCGWTIHQDTIKAQMEGGIVYGLTAALKSEITIQNGRVAQKNFNDYPMLRHNEMPAIEVAIMQNEETPGGIGEPSTAGIAGSLVNAVAAATRKRVYKLPIRPQDIRTTA